MPQTELLTPRKHQDEFAEFLQSSSKVWDINLPIPDRNWSPSNRRSESERCVEMLKYIFWTKKNLSIDLLEWRETSVDPALRCVRNRDDRLKLLAQLLGTAMPRLGTYQRQGLTDETLQPTLRNIRRTVPIVSTSVVVQPQEPDEWSDFSPFDPPSQDSHTIAKSDAPGRFSGHSSSNSDRFVTPFQSPSPPRRVASGTRRLEQATRSPSPCLTTPSRSARPLTGLSNSPASAHALSSPRGKPGHSSERDVSPTARLSKSRLTSRDQTAVDTRRRLTGDSVANTATLYPALPSAPSPRATDSWTPVTSATASFTSTIDDKSSDAATTSFGTDITEPDHCARKRNGHDESSKPVAKHQAQSLQHDPTTATPLKHSNPVSKPPAKNTTTPLEYYKVRDLPGECLFHRDTPSEFLDHHMSVRFECTRIALENDLDPSEVFPPVGDQYQDLETLWKFFQDHPRIAKLPPKCAAEAWEAAKTTFDRVIMKGRLILDPRSSSSVFRLQLGPLELSHNSRRFLRAFGHDRFLQLEVPSLTSSKAARFRGQAPHLESRFQEWLMREHKAFGRTWRVFQLKNVKKDKGVRREENEYIRQLFLFATEGCDIKLRGVAPVCKRPSEYSFRLASTIPELLDWFMPFNRLSGMSYLKAFSRLDLGLSRTTPSLTFRPEQVRWIDDIRANDDVEDDSFNDPDNAFAAQWKDFEIKGKRRVMNDGCARISLGAARLIWQELGGSGPLPSAFQARIGGAKGVWMRSHDVESPDPDADAIWIEINPSQSKFKPAEEDRGARYDPDRLTFEVVNHSHSPIASTLHLSFVPILLDRGVPASALENIIVTKLDQTLTDISESLRMPGKMRAWLSEVHSKLEELDRSIAGMDWLGGLPASLLEKVIFLLESGFDPRENHFLAGLTHRLIARYYTRILHNLRFKLGKSSMMLGVADPTSQLKPGHLHVSFSETFVDDDSGATYQFLDQRDVLIARHPALRISDIQRYRAVFLKELNHLRDVVVFPSTGTFPTAAKLQGGDYDGDTFWICWEDNLVKPFRNAPAPVDSPQPENFGIEVDRRSIQDILDPNTIHEDPSGVDSFLKESFAFASLPNLLGEATNLHERLAYRNNTIRGDDLEALADLHDLLVDSAKNGYKLTRDAYNNFLTSRPIDVPVSAPAWKVAMQQDFEKQHFDTRHGDPGENHSGARQHVSPPPHGDPCDAQKFLDRLFFEVVMPRINASLEETKKILNLKDQSGEDMSLVQPYLAAKQSGDTTVQKELSALRHRLSDLNQHWKRLVGGPGSRQKFVTAVTLTYKAYMQVEPVHKEHPAVGSWISDSAPGAPTQWDLIKASLLYHMASARALPFHVAGRELAYLKAFAAGESWQSGETRAVTRKMWSIMKPRKQIATMLGSGPASRNGIDAEEGGGDQDMLYLDDESGEGWSAADDEGQYESTGYW